MARNRLDTTREPTFTGAPTLLTVDETAFLTGLNRKTLYEAANAKQLPGARRIGRAFRVHRDTLLEWFRQGRSRRASRPRPCTTTSRA